MKLTNGGKVLVVLFAATIVGLGLLASLRTQPAITPSAQPPVVSVTGAEPDIGAIRSRLIRAAGEVEALDAQIAATQSSLELARAEGEARIISRKDDRDRVASISEQIVGLKTQRARMLSAYEAEIAAADSRATAGLPTFRKDGAP